MPNLNGIEEKRFGFTVLPKDMSNIAYPKEILGNHYTGEFLFKSPEVKDLISFDYNTRVRAHIENAEIQAKTLGLFGKIYAVDNDGLYSFPSVVPFNTTLLDTRINIPSNATKLLFNIDLDCLTCFEGEVSKVIEYPSVQFDISIRDNTLNVHSVIRELKLTELNRTIIDVNNIIGDDAICNEIILNNVKITPNKEIGADLSRYRLILYGICIALA